MILMGRLLLEGTWGLVVLALLAPVLWAILARALKPLPALGVVVLFLLATLAVQAALTTRYGWFVVLGGTLGALSGIVAWRVLRRVPRRPT